MTTSSTLTSPHAVPAVAHPAHSVFGFQQTCVIFDSSGYAFPYTLAVAPLEGEEEGWSKP